MVHYGIVFMTCALVFYSIAVWTETIRRKLKLWIAIVFILGFICDTTGTSIMLTVAINKFDLSFHYIAGYVALSIMGGHVIWLILAMMKVRNCEKYFTKLSIIAWILWVIAFLSGIPRA
jgi:uncharacterized repeat protein (TIGR03987 family)